MDNKFPGALSLVTMSTGEKELLLDYLDKTKPSLNVRYLNEVFPDSDFLMFFDVFSGKNIKVPSREEMEKIVSYIKIYNYCKQNGFTDLAYENAAKLFGRRVNSIQRVVERVKLHLEFGEELE